MFKSITGENKCKTVPCLRKKSQWRLPLIGLGWVGLGWEGVCTDCLGHQFLDGRLRPPLLSCSTLHYLNETQNNGNEYKNRCTTNKPLEESPMGTLNPQQLNYGSHYKYLQFFKCAELMTEIQVLRTCFVQFQQEKNNYKKRIYKKYT
jgi:hypothetical protein